MAGGRVLFQGPPADAAPYWRALGYEPGTANASDFALDVAVGVARRAGALQYTTEVLARIWAQRREAAAAAAAAAGASSAAGGGQDPKQAAAVADAATATAGVAVAVVSDAATQVGSGVPVAVQVSSPPPSTAASYHHHRRGSGAPTRCPSCGGSSTRSDPTTSEPASVCSTCASSPSAHPSGDAATAQRPIAAEPPLVQPQGGAPGKGAPPAAVDVTPAPPAAPAEPAPTAAAASAASEAGGSAAPPAPGGPPLALEAHPAPTLYQLHSPPPTARRRQVAVPVGAPPGGTPRAAGSGADAAKGAALGPGATGIEAPSPPDTAAATRRSTHSPGDPPTSSAPPSAATTGAPASLTARMAAACRARRGRARGAPTLPPFSSTGASLALTAVGVTCGVLAVACAAVLQGAASWAASDGAAALLRQGGGAPPGGGPSVSGADLGARLAREAARAYNGFLATCLVSVALSLALAGWAGALWTRRAGLAAARSPAGGLAVGGALCGTLAMAMPPSPSPVVAAARLAFAGCALAVSLPLAGVLTHRWARDAEYTRLRQQLARIGGDEGGGKGTPLALPARPPAGAGGAHSRGGGTSGGDFATAATAAAAACLRAARGCCTPAATATVRACRPRRPPGFVRAWQAEARSPSFASQLRTLTRRAWLQDVGRLRTTMGVCVLMCVIGAGVGLVFRSVDYRSWVVRLLLVEIIVFLAAATTAAGHAAGERALNRHERALGASPSAAFLARQLATLPTVALQALFFVTGYLSGGRIYGAPGQQLGVLLALGFAGSGLGALVAVVAPRSVFLIVAIAAVGVCVFNSFSPTFPTLRALGLSPGAATAMLAWSPIRWAAEGLLLSEIQGLPGGWAARRAVLLAQYEYTPAHLTRGDVYWWPVLFGVFARAAAWTGLLAGWG